jgi:hypothetical protein
VPKTTSEDSDVPVTYYELQKRQLADADTTPANINEAVPRLPPESPWASDPVPIEPFIQGEKP